MYLEYCLQLEHKPVARDGSGSAQKLSEVNSCLKGLNSIAPARKSCCSIKSHFNHIANHQSFLLCGVS